MANVAITDLINHYRFSNDNVVALVLYIPIGLILLITRAIIGIQLWLVSAILPEVASIRQMYTNFACLTLGTITKPKGKRDKAARLLISNHVSVFDPLALYMTTGCLSPGKWDLPPALCSAIGIKSLFRTTTDEQVQSSIRKHLESNLPEPIALQPEELPTNGTALLKFKEWPFTFADKIQPVAIVVSRWFGNVTVSSAGDLWAENVPWSDVLWYLFNPCTFYTINLLPAIERRESETDRSFADRAQKAIADYLKVGASEVSREQIGECVGARERERERERPRPAASPLLQTSFSQRPELQTMATQVKEVLPAVPISIILKELARTRCVDVTITNILEGGVAYTPEPIPAAPAESVPSGPSSSGLQAIKSSSFAKNAQERQLSFQDRKAQMIEAARRRYIEKHGLNVA